MKRVLANRQSAQRSRIRKLAHIEELMQTAQILQNDINKLGPQLAALHAKQAGETSNLPQAACVSVLDSLLGCACIPQLDCVRHLQALLWWHACLILSSKAACSFLLPVSLLSRHFLCQHVKIQSSMWCVNVLQAWTGRKNLCSSSWQRSCRKASARSLSTSH